MRPYGTDSRSFVRPESAIRRAVDQDLVARGWRGVVWECFVPPPFRIGRLLAWLRGRS